MNTGVLSLGFLFIPLFSTLQQLRFVALAQTDFSLTLYESWPVLILSFLSVIFLNALFVAGEVSLDLLKPIHLKVYDDHSAAQETLRGLLDHRPRYVAACVLGAQTMAAWLILLCVLASPRLATSWHWIGQETPLKTALPLLLAASALLSLPVVGLNVIVSELIAKNYAEVHPQRAALRLSRFVKFFAIVFRVPAALAMQIASLITRRFGATATFTYGNEAEEEIRGILENYEETGEIEHEEREMLHSVFEFGDTVAREIMTPRVDVESVAITTPLSQIADLVEMTGHSRFPVFEGTDDEIIGIVHAKDVLRALSKGEMDTPLPSIMRSAMFVPENKSLHDLLKEMKAERAQMVVVQDEFGGTAGIVTVEDIVEEVVGEIVDEYDPEETPILATEGGHVVEGRLHLDDVNEAVGSHLESDEFDTIGGYVFGLFGRQPREGEWVESQGHRFTISQTDGRRISAIKVEKIDSGESNNLLIAQNEGSGRDSSGDK